MVVEEGGREGVEGREWKRVYVPCVGSGERAVDGGQLRRGSAESWRMVIVGIWKGRTGV